MIDRSKIGNAFAFVTIAAERTRQLQRGALPRVADRGQKPATIAQAEVSQGLVRPVDATEADAKKE